MEGQAPPLLLLGLRKFFPLPLLFSFSSAKLISIHCCFDEDAIFDYGEKREKEPYMGDREIDQLHR